MVWHGRLLTSTELYSTVPMLSLGTGGAVLSILWIGSCFGSLSDLSTAHGTPATGSLCFLFMVAVAR